MKIINKSGCVKIRRNMGAEQEKNPNKEALIKIAKALGIVAVAVLGFAWIL